MKSTVPAAATWVTSDDTEWFLRDTTYSTAYGAQPNGDYDANCYMDLHSDPSNEDDISFDDYDCRAHSRSYYCQPTATTTTTTTTTIKAVCDWSAVYVQHKGVCG